MKPIQNFNRNNVISETSVEQLPVDRSYVVNIMGAKEVETQYGAYLAIQFDIAEGDYKDYYNTRYEADKKNNEDAKWKGVLRLKTPVDKPETELNEQEQWTVKSFNTNIVAIEDSNPGYVWDWDEKKLFGKKAGLVFRNKEWSMNGRTGFFSEPYKLISVEDARNNKFKQPKDKLLNNSTATSAPTPTTADEIPFN